MAKAKTNPHATDDFPSDNMFKMGELVCLKKTGVMYHVVGVSLYLGYDFCLWVYTLAKPHYRDAVVGGGVWRTSRENIDMVKDVKEIDIVTAAQAYETQRQELQTKINSTVAELAKLQEQAARLPK